ncbi:MAG: hypothetical protein ACLGIF_11245 [Actinomycetes bacterium]
MAGAIAVRAVLFVLGWMIFRLLAESRAGLSEAEIGLGLLAFALLAVVAAVWAAVDGRRGTPLAPLLVRWAVVTVLVAVFVPLYSFLRAGAPTVGTLANDLIIVTPLVALVMFGPAAIAAAAGAMGASRQRALRRQLPPYQ